MTNETGQILNESRGIKIEIEFIKKHMVDVDSIMTEKDYEALKEYKKEKKAGKLFSNEEIKKELKL